MADKRLSDIFIDDKNGTSPDPEMDAVVSQLLNLQFCPTNTQNLSQQKDLPYYYFICISPVALDVSNIKPCHHTCDSFQFRAFLSPEGYITAEVTRDMSHTAVDPGKDGAFIIQSLDRYMKTHGRGLFLYVRVPDDERMGEIMEHLNELSALLLQYRALFELMDVAWISLEQINA